LWYSRETLSQLRYLWQVVETQANESQRQILELIFSDVLFACASPGSAVTSTDRPRRHHWGWIADNVLPKNLIAHSAVRLFESRMAALPEIVTPWQTSAALVLQQDARHLALKDASIDLIVTSPPYVGVIDYTRANRLL